MISSKHIEFLKEKKFFNFWKIGTSVESYIKRTILKWDWDIIFNAFADIKDVKFELVDRSNNKLSVCLYEYDRKFIFLYDEGEKEKEFYSASTVRQTMEVLEELKILDNFHENYYKFDEDFIIELKAYFGSNLENELNYKKVDLEKFVYKYILRNVNKKLKQNLIKKLNKWIEDFEDNNVEYEEVELGNFDEKSIINSIIFSWLSFSKNKKRNNPFSKWSELNERDLSYYKELINKIELNNENTNLNSLNENMDELLNILNAKKDDDISNILYTNEEAIVTKDLDRNKFYIDDNEAIYKELVPSFDVLNVQSYFNKLLNMKISIPVFQRSYVWNEEYVLRIVGDLINISSNNSNQKEILNLGIVYWWEKTANNQVKEIIDGQQRTVTLILIAYSLYKLFLHAKNFKLFLPKDPVENMFRYYIDIKDNFNGLLPRKITSIYSNISESDSYNSLSIALGDDWNAAEGKNSEFYKTNIYKNLKAITKKLYDYFFTNNKDAEKKFKNFVQAFYQKTFLTTITTNQEQTPKNYELFQRINLYSKPLTSYDLVRNFVYGQLSEKSSNVESNISKFDNFFKPLFISKSERKTLVLDSKLFDNYVNFNSMATINNVSINSNELSNNLTYNTFVEVWRKLSKKYSNYSELIDKLCETVEIFRYFAKNKLIINSKNKYNWAYDNLENMKFLVNFIIGKGKTIYIPLLWSIFDKMNLFNFDLVKESTIILLRRLSKVVYKVARIRFFNKFISFKGESLTKSIKKIVQSLNDDCTNFDELAYKNFVFLKNYAEIGEINEKMKQDLLNKKTDLLASSDDPISLLLLINYSIGKNNKNLHYFENDEQSSYFKDWTNLSWEHLTPVLRNKSGEVDQERKYLNLLGNAHIASKKTNSSKGNKKLSEKFDNYIFDKLLSLKFTYNVEKNELKDNVEKHDLKDKEFIQKHWENLDEQKQIMISRSKVMWEQIYKVFEFDNETLENFKNAN